MSSVLQIIDGTALAHGVGRDASSSRNGLVLLPGAFDPLHAGHLKMAQIAAERLGRPVHFELSVLNVDKRSLDERQCRTRMAQFDASQTVWLTRAATFREKVQLFPQATFVVGTDTIDRVAQLAYHDNDATRRDQAVQDFVAASCRFLVFGRQLGAEFRVLSELDLPNSLMLLCDEVPEAQFRKDVSSSDLRS